MVHYERRARTEDVLWRKAYHYLQWRRMRRYELAVCRRFDKVIVPSPTAKVQLLAESSGLNVDVVPFGITLPDVPLPTGPPEPSEEKRILFVGSMGRPLNVEAVLYFYGEIWPRIRQQEPDTEFWIVGSSPPPQICRLTQAEPNVKVTGFVDDLAPAYAQASVVVVPLMVGGGVVTKILDAMAMSKAIVTTSIANEGIAAVPGRDIVVTDQPGRFAREVIALLRDPERRQRLGRNARRFVEERFSWPGIVERFESICEAMLLGH
jgi:glycosyltransferase involved in cell wall biosynthesis